MKTGVSLVELLLVISIISILVSLLLAGVSKARIHAQKVSCRVTLRSYAMQYSDTGKLIVTIPQEANCHQCHKPRYNAKPVLKEFNP